MPGSGGGRPPARRGDRAVRAGGPRGPRDRRPRSDPLGCGSAALRRFPGRNYALPRARSTGTGEDWLLIPYNRARGLELDHHRLHVRGVADVGRARHVCPRRTACRWQVSQYLPRAYGRPKLAAITSGLVAWYKAPPRFRGPGLGRTNRPWWGEEERGCSSSLAIPARGPCLGRFWPPRNEKNFTMRGGERGSSEMTCWWEAVGDI